MEFLRKKLIRIMIRVKLILIVMLLGASGSYARVWSQADRMNVKTENVNLAEFFGILQQKTDLRFVFNHEDVQKYSVRVDASDKTLSEVLDIALTGKPLQYEITSSHVIISRSAANAPAGAQQAPAPATVTINGTVRDKMTNTPMAGVTVIDNETKTGTVTDANGRYVLNIPKRDRITLSFQFLGMRTLEVVWSGRTPLDVLMEEDAEAIGEVVVTGFFERKAESFTGSASTFNREQLRNVSSGNVFESLRLLDPAVTFNTNDLYGSDPNQLADINIRGKTSIVDPRENLATDPNQPLYILDGFQATTRQVMNLNINRIQSVTVLKDAASTAIYGAQAANGVIVIETVKPHAGKLRVEYNGSFSLQFADLSDYNLMNAREKLAVEVASGVYNHSDTGADYALWTLYNQRLERVMRGVDTYWLKVPVRNGVTQRHNINVGGGDQTVLYGIGATYAGTQGVMKKSGNDNVQFNIDLQYRTGQFLFSNYFTLENHQTEDPPVPFSSYARINPYYEIPSGTQQKYLEEYEYSGTAIGGGLVRVANPLYNESLKYINESRMLTFTDNFYTEWRPVDGLKVVGRLQVSLNRGKTEYFKSPFHTDYAKTATNERGRYQKGNSELNGFSANYYKVFAGKHNVFANATAIMESSKNIIDSYAVVGFADDIIPYPSFAGQYEPGKLPGYSQLTYRRANFFIQTGYVYDNRYSFDFTVREDGTSNYGRGKLYSTFWSAGVAWSIHREEFMLGKVDLLKLRFSIGTLGNDNANYTTETIYQYYSQSNLFGSGLYINQFGNY